MRSRRPFRPWGGRLRPTVALFLPPVTWFLFQQGLSVTMRADCAAGGPPIGLAWGAASLLLCAFTVRLVWPAIPPSPLEGKEMPRFLALLALAGSGIFALAIGFQTLAILVIPPCIG